LSDVSVAPSVDEVSYRHSYADEGGRIPPWVHQSRLAARPWSGPSRRRDRPGVAVSGQARGAASHPVRV